MRCNGFGLFLGEGATERLLGSLGRVNRSSRRVLVSTGGSFTEVGERLPGSKIAIVVRLIEGEGMPAVHGVFLDGEESRRGEFSFLDKLDGGFCAGRDLLGTRPLYLSRDGRSVASDHRFMPAGESELLPPGATYCTRDASVRTRELSRWRPPNSLDEAASKLATLVDESVKSRVGNQRTVAVSFSGGLDSSIVAYCAAKYTEVMLCSAFASGSRDETHAQMVAEGLGFEIITSKLTRETVQRELRAMDLPFVTSPMDEALWCIYSTTARIAKENGAQTIFLGQLADELFGGYRKYVATSEAMGESAAEKMMREDVAACGRVGFIRDEQACSRQLEPRFPFADEMIAEFGLSVPVRFKIKDGVRKLILREAAKVMGLPDRLVEVPKKAAQYSSGVLRLLP